MEDFRHLMLFAKVVDFGGISAAARALSIPKATISRAVASLESSLGIRLLERSGRKMRLTEAGSVVHQHCQRIAEEIEEAQAAVNEIRSVPRGRLRVAAPLTFGRTLLSPSLSDFLRTHPDIRVELELTNRQVDPIEENFDVVIRLGPLADSTLIAKEIGTVHFVLCAGPGYLSSHPDIRCPIDLEQHLVIDFFGGADHRQWSLSRGQEVAQVKVRPRLDVNDPIVRRDAALADIGITLLPAWIANREVQKNGLKLILPDWRMTPSTRIYALYPNRRSLSAKSRSFLNFLEARIRPELGALQVERSDDA
ncbi:LysR family transcriptional regulator [Bradyrhizobium manausense]|uniref:LysR family transcriptional regulator n=1 Tax=Bradyrhizobium TaxID=374 RepID=UPI001BA68356|nr:MULTISPECIES: LysR family transcriptional regulator [Bradyrhizobium]MBR0831139.1 LysR family transcriptional regulator [Bradyrhizobium manausense]UVO29172.1 LysR family transcriptional regulator [Bradyrhizobium arachidis]